MSAERDAPRSSPGVRCPTCGERRPWADNPNRPFCTLECRLIDLGRWLDERYRIEEPEDEETTTSESDADVR